MFRPIITARNAERLNTAAVKAIKQELHAELLKEALADSRRKADFIAEAMGQKIVGIEQVDHHGSAFSHSVHCIGFICKILIANTNRRW